MTLVPRSLIFAAAVLLAASAAHADTLGDLTSCLEAPAELAKGALDPKRATQAASFVINHPTCVADLVDADPVSIAMGVGFSAAKELGVFDSESACTQVIDGPIQGFIAGLISKYLGTFLPSSVVTMLNALAAGEASSALREIPGLDVIFDHIDCACAVAFSGAPDALVKDVKSQAEGVVGCAGLIEGAAKVLIGWVSDIGSLLGFGSCDAKLTASQYGDAVYDPNAKGLALATQATKTQWWNQNGQLLFDQCIAYYRSGSSHCRMSQSSAEETCHAAEEPFWQRVDKYAEATKAERTAQLKQAIAGAEPKLTAVYQQQCNTLDQMKPDCLSWAISSTLAVGYQAAISKLTQTQYNVSAAIVTHASAAGSNWKVVMAGYQKKEAAIAAQLKAQDEAQQKGITSDAAAAWEKILVGVWTPKCPVKGPCRGGVLLMAHSAAALMVQKQAENPDASSTSIAQGVLAEARGNFQKLIDGANKQKANWEKLQTSQRQQFFSSLKLKAQAQAKACARNRAHPEAPSLPDCTAALEQTAAAARFMFVVAYPGNFPPYEPPAIAQLTAFFNKQLAFADAAMAKVEKKLKAKQAHALALRKQAALAISIAGTWCDQVCPDQPIAGGKRTRTTPACVPQRAVCERLLTPVAGSCVSDKTLSWAMCANLKSRDPKCHAVTPASCDPEMKAALARDLPRIKAGKLVRGRRTARLAR